MNKFEGTIKELKEDIKNLEKEAKKKINSFDLDDNKKEKINEFVESTKNVINSSIDKISSAINELQDDEKLDALFDKVKAKSKEAVDYALSKIDNIINNKDEITVDSLHDDIMASFDKLKESDAYKKTTILIKEGYAKLNEFLEKPEVKEKINSAKKTTIKVAEKGVEELKKVLVVDEPKKATKKATKAKATKKTTKKTEAKKQTKKKAAK